MDRFYYSIPGSIPAEKYKYAIDGCSGIFKAYDEGRVTTKYDEHEIGYVNDYDENGKIKKQHITVWIPKELFSVDMQYACIKQNDDTSLHVVAEESLSEDDTACRVFFPLGHFVNIRKQCIDCIEEEQQNMDNFMFINIVLIPDDFIYMEPN